MKLPLKFMLCGDLLPTILYAIPKVFSFRYSKWDFKLVSRILFHGTKK